MRAHGLAEHIRVETGDFTEEGGYSGAVRLLAGNAHRPRSSRWTT